MWETPDAADGNPSTLLRDFCALQHRPICTGICTCHTVCICTCAFHSRGQFSPIPISESNFILTSHRSSACACAVPACLRACVPVTVPAAVLPLPLSLLLAPFLGVVTSYKLEKVEILLPKRGRVTRPPSPSEPPPPPSRTPRRWTLPIQPSLTHPLLASPSASSIPPCHTHDHSRLSHPTISCTASPCPSGYADDGHPLRPRQLTCKAKYPPSDSVSKRISHSFSHSLGPRGFLPSSPARCSPALSSQYPVTRRLPVFGQSLPAKSRPHATPTLVAFFLFSSSFLLLSVCLFWSSGLRAAAQPALPALVRCWSIIRRVKTSLRPSTSTSISTSTSPATHIAIAFTIGSDSDQTGPGRNLRSLRLVPLSSQTTDFLTPGPAHLRPQPANSTAPAHTPTCEREHARQVPLTRPN